MQREAHASIGGDTGSIGKIPNLVSLFLTRAEEKGEAPFLSARRNGEWVATSWAEAERQVAALSGALLRIGVRPGERVLLLSENRPEWCIADLAIMATGAVTVPVYTTNLPRDHEHILTDADPACVIMSGGRLAENLYPALKATQSVRHVIAMDNVPTPPPPGVALHLWHELIDGERPDRFRLADAAGGIGRDDLACIIYTSGTGGAPRGVMQSHGAILHNVEGAGEILLQDFDLGEERFLSFLPLSHAYEHTGGQFLPIAIGAEIFYAEGLDKLASNIEQARPTVMIVVPRLFDLLRIRITKAVEKQGAVATRMLDEALAIARRREAGMTRLLDPVKHAVLARVFLPKIQARFGGRMKAMVSGGAPLNPAVGRFFEGLGLTLLQGYGQTECGPVISCNRPRAGLKMDTVGPPLKNTEVAIAEDGEILVRGELVMLGYWRNAEETANTIRDGWLHTGDIGLIDNAGRIVITDRKKDIIVNDKGDNVAPQRIENMLALEPEIAQAMIHGDNRPYISALIVPDAEWAEDWAKARGLEPDLAALRTDRDFKDAVQDALGRVNAGLSIVEKVRRYAFADEPFGIENGELTPSLKIRRHKIQARYAERIDALYHR